MRLDKYLADMGVGTRSLIKEKIKKGCVTVNAEVAKRPEQQVKESDKITLHGREVGYAQVEYYMLNKPAGYVSATEDKRHKTVLDLIDGKKRKDLFPVGRLDIDTEGFLLITNDGALAHQLLSPKKHVEKSYYARVKGRVDALDIAKFIDGVDIGEEKKTLPAALTILKSDDISEVEITIMEGKYHQIKRMFEAVDKEVIYLKRLSMGKLLLDEKLALGAYRALSEEEIAQLKGK